LSLEALEDRNLPTADVVLQWNAIALQAMVDDSWQGANQQQAGPDRSSRALAIVQTAVFDAVNSIDGSYDPYMINVKAAPDASITAAAAQAAHDTLVNLYPHFAPTLDADLAATLASVTNVNARNHGALVGQVVAAGILAGRSNDGSNVPMSYTFAPPGTPGAWQPDPLHSSQHPIGPMWGDVTTFGVLSAEQFEPPPPLALNSADYATALAEVKALGGDGLPGGTPTTRTALQTNIAFFWGYDGSPGLAFPPREYNQYAEVIAAQQHNSVVENARFFALIDIALADSAITCWDAKYDYNFWRPVTGIRADGNPADANWTPLGAPADNNNGTNFTPAFPSYTSGHATFGAALFRMMADFYGTDNVSFTLHSDEFNGITKDQNGNTRDPNFTRSFTSFSAAAEENGQSRIYLGIHWSFDKTQGIACGDHIADYIFGNLLTPHHGNSRNDSQGPPLDTFRADTSGSGMVLATIDQRPFDASMSTHTPSTTIPTTATGTHDTAAMTSSLVSYLNAGPWGGRNRGGHVLEVDLNGNSADMFKVF
jgi:hypothetical protein